MSKTKTNRVLILTGDVKTACWSDSKDLDSLQEAVKGNIEGLYIGKIWSCYANEEGLISRMPQNESAAYLMNHLTGSWNGLIYGPAVFVFEGRSKKDLEKASAWFEKYKSDQISEDES